MPKKKKSRQGRPREGRVRLTAYVKPDTRSDIESKVGSTRRDNTIGKVLDNIINPSVN